jgi:two-component system sensor histidine kinase/response regulator
VKPTSSEAATQRRLPSAFAVRYFVALALLGYASLPGQNSHGFLSQGLIQLCLVAYLALIALVHAWNRVRPIGEHLPQLLMALEMPGMAIGLPGDSFPGMPSQLVILIAMVDHGTRHGVRVYQQALAAGMGALAVAYGLRAWLVPNGIGFGEASVTLFMIALALYLWLLLAGRREVDDALEEAHRQMRVAVTATEIGIWTNDLVARRITWDENTYAIAGITPEQFSGSYEDYFALFDPDQARHIESEITAAVQERRACEFDARLSSKDGSTRYIGCRAQPIYDAAGKPLRVVGVSWDNTRQRLENEALRDYQTRLSLALRAANLGVWSADLRERRITWDENCYRIFGQERESFGGGFDDLLELIHPDDLPRVKEATVAAAERRAPYSVEYRVIRPGGSERNVVERAEFQFDETGQPARVVGVYLDTTEQRTSQEQLRSSEARFHNAFEHAPIGMALVSPDGHWIKVNRSTCDITGYAPHELLAKTFQDVTHPDDLEADLQLVDKLLRGEIKTYQMEKRYLHKRGHVIWVLLSVSLVRDSQGRPLHFVSQILDITDRKRSEEALREARDEALTAVNAKSEFLANMSHEIRTPMNAVIGMNEKLIDLGLTPMQREVAERVRYSAQSLLTVINDVLDFSKGEAGALELDIAPFELRRVVEGAMDMVAEQAHGKGLHLSLSWDRDVPPSLVGDAGRIHQVMTNLLSNALKFTHQGEIAVTVRTESIVRNEILLRIAVRDSGIGVSKTAQAKLFQPFSQADSSTTRKYGGTGLGLSISKRLVELMGGEIGVDSVVEQGSTFWFTARMIRNLDARPADRARLKGKRVLVIEDHAGTRDGIVADLLEWGMTVRTSPALGDALALLASEQIHYDFIIVDSAMLGMVHVEFARRLRQNPALASTRALVLRPRNVTDEAARAPRPELDAVISKPVREAVLYKSLLKLAGLVSEPAARPVPSGEIKKKDWRVLVAEDNPMNQEVVQHQLEKLGLQAEIVGNGEEVLDALQQREYDVIFMDCQMPVLDGYRAAMAIREREPLNRHAYIIAMTAHAMQGDREKCLASGMDDYLSKPTSVEMLRAALERYEQSLAPEPLAPPAIQDRPPMDPTRLLELARSQPSRLRRLVETYIQVTTSQLTQLRTATGNRAAEDIGRIAHQARGSSGVSGMNAMNDLFLRIESAASTADWTSVCGALDEADLQFTQARSFLRQLCAQDRESS